MQLKFKNEKKRSETENPKSQFFLYSHSFILIAVTQREKRQWSLTQGFPQAVERAARLTSPLRRACVASWWARLSRPISGRSTTCGPFRFARTTRCRWWGEPTRAARAKWSRSIAASGSSTSSASPARRLTAPPSTLAFTLPRLSSPSFEWTRTANPCSIGRPRVAPPPTRKRVPSSLLRMSCRPSINFSLYFFALSVLSYLLLLFVVWISRVPLLWGLSVLFNLIKCLTLLLLLFPAFIVFFSCFRFVMSRLPQYFDLIN